MAKKRHHANVGDPETPDTEIPDTETPDTETPDTETPDTENQKTPPGFEGANLDSPSAKDHVQNADVQHGSAALPGGEGAYHPHSSLEETPEGPDAPRSVQSAPYLDEDTHDFGPAGAEDQCRKCGKTRAELAIKVGRKLTHAELKGAEGSPLLPPRIR